MTQSVGTQRGKEQAAENAIRSFQRNLCGEISEVRTDGWGRLAVSLLTLQHIKAFAAQQPTILLPAHHPDVPARLAGNKLLD